MFRFLSISASFLILLSSCKNTSRKTDSPPKTAGDSVSVQAEEAAAANEEARTPTILKFEELQVEIQYALAEGDWSNIITEDSITLSIEVGESIEDQRITVSNTELENITVEQRFETSVTISKEGPHCDLTDWKHFYSDWKPIKRKGNEYLFPSFSTKEREQFVEVSMDEVKAAVKAECGDDWAELLNSTTNIHEYPCGVGISRYFIRISGKTKAGAGFQKVIVIESPMGC